MDQVGFTFPCASVWAWDEVHTKNHAMFTFLQALVSNFVTNMAVNYPDVTMAKIDEAISGPVFVPSVGATRRRMNIISDIRRPENQQCTVATQDWAQVFQDPFMPPVGGVYTVKPSDGSATYVATVVGKDGLP